MESYYTCSSYNKRQIQEISSIAKLTSQVEIADLKDNLQRLERKLDLFITCFDSWSYVVEMILDGIARLFNLQFILPYFNNDRTEGYVRPRRKDDKSTPKEAKSTKRIPQKRSPIKSETVLPKS